MTEQDATALLADLDAEQRHAVTTPSTLVAVIAGAGSGKTRVLTRRVAHRILTGSAQASHTLVLTFTREAAGELRRRLPRLGLAHGVTAGTFHAVSHQLLRQRWADTDRAPRSILTDRRRLVAEVAGGHDLDEVLAEIEFAGARGLGPAAYRAAVRSGERRPGVDADRVAEVMTGYDREKRRRGVADLDDLLALLVDEMRCDDDYAAGIRWRFRHLHVDEAQDLNPLQHQVIDLLRSGRDDLFLVGDPAQAVYGFNGSDPSLLTDVAERFPGVEVVRLTANHRCTPQIVAVGAHALRTGDRDQPAVSARPDGRGVDVVDHPDETTEAAKVAVAVVAADPGLVRDGRIAVLARTHGVLQPVRAALEAAGVVVRRPVDESGPIGRLLGEAYRIPDADRLRHWVRDLTDDEVAVVATDFLREHPTGDGQAFRAWIAATDPFGGRAGGVDLLTFHAAKGREWHTVHLVGCETSLVPHRSATTNAARAEEARLLHVALTRATDELVVHWAHRRNGYQRRRTPFLDDFSSDAPPSVAPPVDLPVRGRSTRSLTLERLHTWRAGAARAAGVLPEALCTDRVLADIATHRPTTADELDRITGLGALTARRLFAGIAEALSGADQSRSTITGA